MEYKRTIYSKIWILIHYLFVVIFSSFAFPVLCQEITVPKLKYEKEFKDKGCGNKLNREGLKLQDEGLGLFFTKGKTAEAVNLLEKAIEHEPRLHPSYIQLSSYYLSVGKNPKKAILLLKKGVKHCSRQPILYLSLANAYAFSEQHQEAIINYNKAEEVGMEPTPPFHYNLANSYAKLKEFDKAIDNYRKALSMDEKHFNAWRNLVITYYEKGDKKNAVECARKLEKLDPTGNFDAWAREAIKKMK